MTSSEKHASVKAPKVSLKVTRKVTWDENGQPISSTFGDIYFSKKNGLEESRYVFLDGNQLSERFSQLSSGTSSTPHFTIAETGFGTGLNFLSCWQLWQQYAPGDARLTFISVEKYPLNCEELSRSLALWPELNSISQALIKTYQQTLAPELATTKSLSKAPFYLLEFGKVRLILIIGDADLALKNSLNCGNSSLSIPSSIKIDAWFLDGFAPAKNPDMWSQSLFKTMGKLSHDTTTLATFTAASDVRRGLNQAGFTISKRKGFSNKREMLTGLFNSQKSCSNATVQKKHAEDSSKKITATDKSQVKAKAKKNTTPWTINRNHQKIQHGDSVAIVGGGLAGCHTAYALAKRNIKTTLIDAQACLASGASGNPQGVIYGKLSAHEQMLSDFNLSCLLYAQQHYTPFWQTQPQSGQMCGVLQLSQTARAQEQHALLGQQYQHSDFLHYLSAKQASAIAGINVPYPALFFPHCGWLAPTALCEWLTQSSLITKIHNTHITECIKTSHGWLLNGLQKKSTDQDGIDEKQIAKTKNQAASWQRNFDHVIIANANAAKQFLQTDWLPTKPIRGQITYLPSEAPIKQLKTVVCSEGYIAPSTSINGQVQHAIGASYNLNDNNIALSDSDHENNIQQLERALNLKTACHNGGRVGFRCTTPDYLPLVGPVPNIDAFKQDYRDLIKNAHTYIPTCGNYHQGLYLNIGHGSRGLAYTPLSAEILACTLTGEALPADQSMVDALNPARFIIRDLCRTNIPRRS